MSRRSMLVVWILLLAKMAALANQNEVAMKKTVNIGAFVGLLVSVSLAAGNKQVSVKNEAAQVKHTIQQYVQRDQQIKGGFFLRDPKSGVIRDLTFDHVDPYIEKTSDN